MKTHRWRDIAEARVGKARLAELDAEAKEEVRLLHKLCEGLGITQEERARLAEIAPSEAPEFERGEDEYISRVREVVEALWRRA